MVSLVRSLEDMYTWSENDHIAIFMNFLVGCLAHLEFSPGGEWDNGTTSRAELAALLQRSNLLCNWGGGIM